MAFETHFNISAGSLFTTILTVTDQDGVTPFNLTDYTPFSQIRQSPFSSTAYDFVCTVEGDPVNGQVKMVLPHATSYLMRPRRYMFDIEVHHTSDTSDVKRIASGTITLEPNITRTTL